MSDANDPQKYIIQRLDFRRLPRWENDGIERYQREEGQEFQTAVSETAIQMQSASPLKRELASILGNWVYQNNLDDPMCRDMILSMPASMQNEAATAQLNLEAAQKHLIQAYQNRDSEAYNILGQIGYRPAIHRASKDIRRFPDFKSLTAKLLQMNLGTDTNIIHLFGNVSYVRGVLLQVGHMVAEPPPPNTPAYVIWHPILNQDEKAERVKRSCAYCEKEEEDSSGTGGGDGANKMATCSNCKSVYYCCKDHQRTHWPVHKPDCLEKQGKPVPEKVHQKAAATLAQWERDKNEQKQVNDMRYREQLREWFQAYWTEENTGVLWSHDCYGRRRRHDFPLHAENLFRILTLQNDNLSFEKEIELGMLPLGMEGLGEETRGLGFLLSDKVSTGKIIVLYERLFADQGNGDFVGIGIVGAFVVDKSITKEERGKKFQKGVWKKVDESADATSGGVLCNRCQRVATYLERARALAKTLPEGVDLGIHDVKDLTDNIQPIVTQFGPYMKLDGA